MMENKLKKIISRLLVFFIGIPLVLTLALFCQCNFFLFHLVMLIVVFVSTTELYNMLQEKNSLQPKALLIVLNLLFPICSYIFRFFNISQEYFILLFIINTFIVLSFEVFYQKYEEDILFFNSANRISNSLFIIFYVGFLSTYILEISNISFPQENLCIFLGMVFACDSLAWFFGMLFGKTNRGFVLASPNKSIVGFLGGILGSVLVGLIGKHFFPLAFNGNITKVIILGICISATSILGDLIESVIKRSSNTKDSGQFIPGRGGLLDSIDSILISAPIYYYLVKLFFGV